MNIKDFHEKYKYLKATPVMQQYLDIKFANIEALLLFRMGDFYELFYEDAKTASRVLSITLTSKGKTEDEAIPMCGIPYHALDNYLNKLIAEGFNVAICDQLETPESAKKRDGYKAVVKRDVVRIITPGTITEESLLDAGAPNYLASLVIGVKDSAICYIDLSTSKIFIISLETSSIINEIARIKPKEVLLAEKYRSSEYVSSMVQLGVRISFQVDSYFAVNKCEKAILDFYQIQSSSAIGSLSYNQLCATGSILDYISLTQKGNIPKLQLPKILNSVGYMLIDASSRHNLEITENLRGGIKGTLFEVMNCTISKGGSRLLHQFLSSPLVSMDQINHRLDYTEFFLKNFSLTQKIRSVLKNTGDLERCLTRLSMKRSTPVDLLSIARVIRVAEDIISYFIIEIGTNFPENISNITKNLLGHHQIYDLITQSIKEDAKNSLNDGEFIQPNYHPKVQELNDLITNSNIYIEKLKDKYKKETGIDTLKISYNNVIGLFIDITSRHSNKITDPKFIHRQTTANSVRYTSVELQELETKVVNARTMVVALEKEIYEEIVAKILEKHSDLLDLANAITHIDVFCNFAYLADQFNYVRPNINSSIEFSVQKGRHPVIESVLSKNGQRFVTNDCKMDETQRILLITGPNMSGKSTFLRQNAILAIMVHIGSFVPAEYMSIGLVDQIFCRIGAGDDLKLGQSTFMVEMLETSRILAQSTNKSLVILDEVGRGTSTYDGVSIAWAVLEHIHDKIKNRCLFATHYHELTQLDINFPALINYTVAVEEQGDKISFLHQIKLGSADRSYGVHVARLAGLPKIVLKRAEEILSKLEKNVKITNTGSINLDMFSAVEEKKNTKNEAIQKKYLILSSEIDSIDPDNLSPIAALEKIYQLKKILKITTEEA